MRAKQVFSMWIRLDDWEEVHPTRADRAQYLIMVVNHMRERWARGMAGSGYVIKVRTFEGMLEIRFEEMLWNSTHQMFYEGESSAN